MNVSEKFEKSLSEELLSKKPSPKCIVRLTTSAWYDLDGCYLKKSLKFLKKKCVGYNILYEDSAMIGFNEVLLNIINLNDCKDGIYKVVTCNERADWETGYVEEYDYKLIPYE